MKQAAPLISILITAAVTVLGCSPPQNEFADPPPPVVTVAKPILHKFTLYVEENGETEAIGEADVRARVDGFIQHLHFEPGQRVAEGDVLYEIEPDKYIADLASAQALLDASRAAVSVAKANQSRAEAEKLRAERDYVRQEGLQSTKAISQADFEAALSAKDSAIANLIAAEAAIEAAEADVKKAEAAVEQANLNVGYTRVIAPISGFVTKTDVKEGNLVNFGLQLATVVNREKILVNFSINDRLLLQLIANSQSEPPPSETQQPPASATSADGKPEKEEDWRNLAVLVRTEGPNATWQPAFLDYVDREGVDRDTGTFALRAVVEQPGSGLVPGLFVKVRLPLEPPESASTKMLIPFRAVQRSQLGDSVMVVDDQNKAVRRSVTLGNQVESWVVVNDGISIDEQIITDGLLKARDGYPVEKEISALSIEDAPIPTFLMPQSDASVIQNDASAGEPTTRNLPSGARRTDIFAAH